MHTAIELEKTRTMVCIGVRPELGSGIPCGSMPFTPPFDHDGDNDEGPPFNRFRAARSSAAKDEPPLDAHRTAIESKGSTSPPGSAAVDISYTALPQMQWRSGQRRSRTYALVLAVISADSAFSAAMAVAIIGSGDRFSF